MVQGTCYLELLQEGLVFTPQKGDIKHMPLLYAPDEEWLVQTVLKAKRKYPDAYWRDKDLGFYPKNPDLNPDPEFLIDLLAFFKPKHPLIKKGVVKDRMSIYPVPYRFSCEKFACQFISEYRDLMKLLKDDEKIIEALTNSARNQQLLTDLLTTLIEKGTSHYALDENSVSLVYKGISKNRSWDIKEFDDLFDAALRTQGILVIQTSEEVRLAREHATRLLCKEQQIVKGDLFGEFILRNKKPSKIVIDQE